MLPAALSSGAAVPLLGPLGPPTLPQQAPTLPGGPANARPDSAADGLARPDSLAARDSLDRFGFPRWAYAVDTLDVQTGVSLNAVFVAEGVPLADAARLVGALDSTVADSVALRADHDLYVYRDSAAVSHFVYEPSPLRYVVLRPPAPADSTPAVVVEVERPVVTERRVVRAKVDGPVAKTLEGLDVPAAYADSLREAFEDEGFWPRRGDSLVFAFDETRVDSVVLSRGPVEAVRLGAGARARYTFRFAGEDGRVDHFDEDGRNLRRFFLASPIRGAIVSSAFSYARLHPILDYVKPHFGTDYSAPFGAPILALADGTVLEATFSGGNGNYVKLQHSTTYTTGYLHMSRIAEGLRPGERVLQGDTIGYVGMTGLATGPHTCLRFYKFGTQQDFQRERPFAAPAVDGVAKRTFAAERDDLLRSFRDVPAIQRYLAQQPLTLDALL